MTCMAMCGSGVQIYTIVAITIAAPVAILEGLLGGATPVGFACYAAGRGSTTRRMPERRIAATTPPTTAASASASA